MNGRIKKLEKIIRKLKKNQKRLEKQNQKIDAFLSRRIEFIPMKDSSSKPNEKKKLPDFSVLLLGVEWIGNVKNEIDQISFLPIEKIRGIGIKTATQFNRYHISTLTDLLELCNYTKPLPVHLDQLKRKTVLNGWNLQAKKMLEEVKQSYAHLG